VDSWRRRDSIDPSRRGRPRAPPDDVATIGVSITFQEGSTMNRLLWVLQVLLALLFTFAGVTKLAMPAEQLTAQSSMSAGFLRFIAVCEILGAVGLVLPWLLRIRPGLTPLAAALLVIIMVGAVVTTVPTMGVGMALIPAVVGVLCALVAWGRWRLTPQPAPRLKRVASTAA
jgi:hypothetical protein